MFWNQTGLESDPHFAIYHLPTLVELASGSVSLLIQEKWDRDSYTSQSGYEN